MTEPSTEDTNVEDEFEDEFGPYLDEAMRDPEFRAAYERAQGTPIFDELHAERAGDKPAPYRHASGEPCNGCQSCLADAADDVMCPACGSSIRRPRPRDCIDSWHDPENIGDLAGEFFEEDEPVADVEAAFAAGEQCVTAPPVEAP